MTTARPKAITRPPKRSEPRAARQHRQHRAPARPQADGRPSAHVPPPELRAPVMKTGGARGLRGPAARTSSAGGTASQRPPAPGPRPCKSEARSRGWAPAAGRVRASPFLLPDPPLLLLPHDLLLAPVRLPAPLPPAAAAAAAHGDRQQEAAPDHRHGDDQRLEVHWGQGGCVRAAGTQWDPPGSGAPAPGRSPRNPGPRGGVCQRAAVTADGSVNRGPRPQGAFPTEQML